MAGDGKGEGSGAKDGVVVQRVVREVSGGTSYPVLTKTNYTEWALLMRVKLRAQALWAAVNTGGVDSQEDMMALDALCSAVPPEMVSAIADKETTKEAWDAIKTMRVGDDRVKKSSAQQLRRQFEVAAFKDGESVEEFALQLSGMVATLATLDEVVEETKVVEKLFCSVPQRFRQIVLAIETLLDASKLTLADATGRLKAAEDAFEPPLSMVQHDGKLYLTEEEWDARRKRREAKNRDGSGGSSKNFARRGRGRSNGHARMGHGGGLSSGGPPVASDQCRRCGKHGHWARECRSKPKKEQAHVAHEEEAALLLLRASVGRIPISSPVQDSPAITPTTRAAKCEVVQERAVSCLAPNLDIGPVEASAGSPPQIREEKVFVQLGRAEENRDAKRWILDTGATNHMTGSRAAFVEMNTKVCGTVRFGDESVARIEGCGTVMFVCKNGEHRSFAGVYYIPQLTTNIVSVGQLDEGGYQVLIDGGVMTIRELGGRLPR
ncbi:uncharacterized protein LOC133930247 [Phragmites australis]|uniref:uncharacterized protein LOC133930247 n=1 Tax=Phragmites australis TaxID=29695 RepID=UPI002D791B6B|nr:uncharacterized protein LOC133930247 [Phragmites australis]